MITPSIILIPVSFILITANADLKLIPELSSRRLVKLGKEILSNFAKIGSLSIENFPKDRLPVKISSSVSLITP